MKPHRYTHIDAQGMLWRFEGSRPISKLADEVMDTVMSRPPRKNRAQGQKRKKAGPLKK